MPRRAYPDELQKWSNSQMVQTVTIAARGVLRPPRSLRMTAAHLPVVHIFAAKEEGRDPDTSRIMLASAESRR